MMLDKKLVDKFPAVSLIHRHVPQGGDRQTQGCSPKKAEKKGFFRQTASQNVIKDHYRGRKDNADQTFGEQRDADAVAQGRFLGLQCPVCGRVYLGGRGYCPVDSVALGAEHEIELPQKGTITNFTIVTPVQYPGQTETDPFARVHVLLDGVDVVLGYQPLIEVAMDDVRIGMRVAAMWNTSSSGRELEGWIPTGEDDVDDPDLVNRIC